MCPIFYYFSDEDSDADLVTDYLSAILKDDETQEIISNNRPKVLVQPSAAAIGAAVSTSTGEHINNITNASNNINTNNHHHHHQNHIHIATMHNNMNMVPIISVTPHSPGSKHNNILGTFHVFVFLYVYIWYKLASVNVNNIVILVRRWWRRKIPDLYI